MSQPDPAIRHALFTGDLIAGLFRDPINAHQHAMEQERRRDALAEQMLRDIAADLRDNPRVRVEIDMAKRRAEKQRGAGK